MTEEKKKNHQVNIVRLGEPRVHPNADTLELYDIEGYQVVTKQGNFHAGDLAVYIQPDSVVPQTKPFKFIWEPYVTAEATGMLGEQYLGLTPERKRRITVRRFRKEWSEGLLMPLSDFIAENSMPEPWVEGDDVSDILSITHWEGEEVAETGGLTDSRPKRRYPKTLKGWVFFLLNKIGLGFKKNLNEELAFEVPKFDVESIKHYGGALIEGEMVYITEKIHGAQGRFFFKEGRMYAGSRQYWRAEKSPCVWRKVLKDQPWIEEYCRAHEGHILYGEVVPVQKGYKYGCGDEAKLFVFDIREMGGEYLTKMNTLEYTTHITTVPVLYYGPWSKELTKRFIDGPSTVPHAANAREGIVITAADPTRFVRGLGRVQVKAVSNKFLEKDNQ